MAKIKINKRIAEQMARLRSLKGSLPAGKARRLENTIERIEALTRKQQLRLSSAEASYDKPFNEAYDARDNEDIANAAATRAKMWAAMIAGKIISVEDGFRTKAFASRISEIRSAIRDENRPYILCDKWEYPGNGRSKYKKYWLMPKQLNQ